MIRHRLSKNSRNEIGWKWVNDLKLSGRIPPSILGSAAQRSGAEGGPRPRATFVMRRNGQSGVAKLNGATILVDEQQKRTGANRLSGTIRLRSFRLTMVVASAFFVLLLPTFSTTKLILNGAQICSTWCANAVNWTGNF